MAAADRDTVGTRVIWAIGARLSSGSYTFDTSDDDRFSDNEIYTAIVETESELVRDICESYHPMRDTFTALSATISHGGEVPERIGQIESIHIEPSSAAGFVLRGEKTTRTNIDLWRENQNSRFDDVDHDQAGSKLAGYYALDGDTLYYTGLNAQAMIATYDPDFATFALQIDEMFTSPLVSGAIMRLAKVGVPPELVRSYANLYARQRADIRQGLMGSPSLEQEQKID